MIENTHDISLKEENKENKIEKEISQELYPEEKPFVK